MWYVGFFTLLNINEIVLNILKVCMGTERDNYTHFKRQAREREREREIVVVLGNFFVRAPVSVQQENVYSDSLVVLPIQQQLLVSSC